MQPFLETLPISSAVKAATGLDR